MIFVYCAVAIVLSIALVWFFFAPRKGEHTVINGAKQEITISINGSYSPALIYAQAGTPLTIYFDRKDSGECTSHVVFPDLGRDTFLPAGRTTTIHLPALSAGDYPFACGMNMVHGMLRVTGEGGTNIDSDTDSDTDATIRETNNTTEVTDSHSNDRTAELNTLKKRFLVGVIFSIPVFILGMGFMF